MIHPCGHVRGSTRDREEETPEMLSVARMTLAAEIEAADESFEVPVIPPERMLDFQREWSRSAGLRALIRAAGRYGEGDVARSSSARALWEMSRSVAWRLGGGRFPYTGEFAVLG